MDPQLESSRRHLKSFLKIVLILAASNLPFLWLGSFQPEPILSRMRAVFAIMGGLATILAVQQKQRLLGPRLTLWDEAAAFFVLAFACSAALDPRW